MINLNFLFISIVSYISDIPMFLNFSKILISIEFFPEVIFTNNNQNLIYFYYLYYKFQKCTFIS